MNVTLIGNFVFISQGYGVLSSVYHNNIDTEPFPETAKRKWYCWVRERANNNCRYS